MQNHSLLLAAPPVTDPLPARSSERLFWTLHTAGWSAAFLMSYLGALAHGKPIGYWKVSLPTYFAGFLLTLILRVLLRAWRELPPLPLAAAMALPVAFVSAGISTVYMVLVQDYCPDCKPANVLGYVAWLTSHIYVVLSWVGMYVGIRYYRQAQQQGRQVLAATAMAHQAQLKMLRYQLNPHFLFNTLNAISTLILDRDTPTANRMVQRLSAFLRHSLDNDPMQRVTLRQELDAIALYLDIEKVRFAERLRVDVHVDDECHDALLPSLLLQPLIENAIKHAVARRVEGGTLEIAARRDGSQLVIAVADDGPGCGGDGPAPAGAGHGVGLANTRERLRVLYGDRQSFAAGNRAPRGFEVVLRLPFDLAPRG